jgi:uncharacterized protein (TIGR03435 family)
MRFAILAVMLCSLGAAQTAFEVASVKVSQGGDFKEAQKSVVFSPTGVTLRSVTIQTAIVTAYGVKDFQVSGSGLGSEHYDIVAKVASPVGDDQLKIMLRGLLADRFKLAFHRAEKETPVYALVTGKKSPKLVEAHAEGSGNVRFQGGEMVFQGFSMAKLADFLSRLRSMDRPVLDMTALPGFFDFTVHFADTLPAGMVEAKAAAEQAFLDPALPLNIAAQVGLKLDARKAPVESIVVDHVERPTEN